MAYYKDMREYLEELDRAGKLKRFSRPINKDTELHPVVRWQFLGLPEKERIGFLFENLTGLKGEKYSCRVASSVMAASREIYALGMKCPVDKINETWQQAYQQPIPPTLVNRGPVKEEVHAGNSLLEHGGMKEFAIPFSTNGWESLPRLTAISWHTKDPDTGVTNVGTYNGTLLGPLHISCRVGAIKHLYFQWKKCKSRKIPLEAAAVIGTVPAVSYASVSPVPYGMAELNVAGGIAKEPIEVVKCETVDLMVPASAEIVLEGEILTDVLEPDAACGENLGYIMIEHMVFAFRIKAITHRKNPIWHDFICQMPPSESSTIRCIAGEGRYSSVLRDNLGLVQVKDVAFHHCSGAWRLCVIRFQDVGGIRTPNYIVQQALLGALSINSDYPKMVIAVDEDINPWDLESVFWAVSSRYQPHRDTKIIQGRLSRVDQSIISPEESANAENTFVFSRTGPQGSSAILIDATRKWSYTPIALPKKNYMERGRQIWEEEGLPKLKETEPWYGVSLGFWPEKYQRQAEWAEKGEYDKVVEDLLKGRKML